MAFRDLPRWFVCRRDLIMSLNWHPIASHPADCTYGSKSGDPDTHNISLSSGMRTSSYIMLSLATNCKQLNRTADKQSYYGQSKWPHNDGIKQKSVHTTAVRHVQTHANTPTYMHTEQKQQQLKATPSVVLSIANIFQRPQSAGVAISVTV